MVELDDTAGDLFDAIRASRAFLLGRDGRRDREPDRAGRHRHHRRRHDQRHVHREPDDRFADTTVLAIGDLRPEAARSHGGGARDRAAGEVDVVLDHPDVEIVVNLTIPAAHAEVAERALAAGKHVWNEKPLALDRAGGRAVLDAAAAAGLRVGCARRTRSSAPASRPRGG